LNRASLLPVATLAFASPLWGAAVLRVRPIQVDYPSQTARAGGQTIAIWEINGTFDEIRLTVDGGAMRIVRGTTTTASLGDLPLGERQVTVMGMVGAVVASEMSASIEVKPSPPVSGIEPDGCLFHSYGDEGGTLEIYWKNRDTRENPYFDFAIYVNGDLQGFLDGPAGGLTFTKVPLGPYSIEVVAFTFNYLCESALIHCTAEEVDPVVDPVCLLERCEAGQGLFRVNYSLSATPPPPEGVAAFDVTVPNSVKFLGNFPPGQPVPPPPLEAGEARRIELVSFRGDSASTVPGADGPHVIVTCSLPAGACSSPRFIRGDSNGDGGVDISDDIYSLDFLFLGGNQPACLSACDLNFDEKLDLSDPIYGLDFKFLGGPPPAPPFPACGPDPGAGSLGCERGC